MGSSICNSAREKRNSHLRKACYGVGAYQIGEV
jgi:hypothetical protein